MSVPRLGALCVLLCLAIAAPASAELTVSKPDATTVRVAETAFAADRLHVDTTSEAVTITADDSMTKLIAGDGCTEPQPEVVSCAAAGVTVVELNLGFHGDVLLAGTGSLRREVDGGFGEDRIHDQPGDDLLVGGADGDTFHMHGGDDEVVGFAPSEPTTHGDQDWLVYSAYTDGVEVVLPASGTSTGNGAVGESDTISGIEHVEGGPGDDHLIGTDSYNFLYGRGGGDILEGGGGGDSLYGDSAYGGADNDDQLSGGAGNDLLWAQAGSDVIEGGPGSDSLNAVDHPLQADRSIDCGDGDGDTVDADNLTDPEPIGCEIIAPEFYDPPEIEAWDLFMEGHWLAFGEFSVTGGSPEDEIETEWWRCPADGDCNLRDITLDPGYLLTDEDVDATLFAVVRVRNEAGGDEYVTDDTPVIEPAPDEYAGRPESLPPPDPGLIFLPPAGPPPGDYGDYGDYADVLGQRLAPLNAALDASLRRLARRWRGHDPRALARRRRIAHRVTFPDTGKLTIAWTAAVGSARAAARRRVTIARGTAQAAKGTSRAIAVRPTKRGRALLRRSKRLRVTLSATFVGGAATAAAPAEAKRTYVLRRR